jgi:hypothetical protein
MLILTTLGLALAGVGAASQAAGTRDLFALEPHADAQETARYPLDLREVTFGQSATQLVLKLRTAGLWKPDELADDALCVVIAQGSAERRLCVGGASADSARLQIGSRTLAATITRHNQRSLSAVFHPRELRLPYGALRWHVESRLTEAGTCAAGCADRLPDRGAYTATIGALGGPRCFGAAARAGARCVNPALRRSIYPSPSRALWMSDSSCLPSADRGRYKAILPCDFGALEQPGPAQVALIGDSHAAHLRAAIDVVAQARGWRAVSITRAGCAFSTEVYPAPAPIPARCRLHSAEAIQWLKRHPSVHTVFMSNSAGRGLGPGGFTSEWSQMPSSVKRLYVIRDIPRMNYGTAGCVQAVLRKGGRGDGACAVARSGAFPFDPAAAAAGGAGSRVRLLDLTRQFCDSSRCYPVIGGAYAYKDFNHLNRVFAATLGPLILKYLP